MKPIRFGIRALLLLLTLLVAFTGCSLLRDINDTYGEELGELGAAIMDQLADGGADGGTVPPSTTSPTDGKPDKNGSYTGRDEVAAYLRAYGCLPGNFITKSEAQAMGWESSAGNLDRVAPGKSIGGDYFGNYEGKLPQKSGRKYYECDIGYTGGYRGAERIVYSNDGLIFYTDDHYESFTELT